MPVFEFKFYDGKIKSFEKKSWEKKEEEKIRDKKLYCAEFVVVNEEKKNPVLYILCPQEF